MSDITYKVTETRIMGKIDKNTTIIFDDICEAEQYFKKEYGCFNTYFGYSTIINGPLLDFTSTIMKTVITLTMFIIKIQLTLYFLTNNYVYLEVNHLCINFHLLKH